MQLTGRPTAIDTLRRARQLASDPDQRARLAVEEVWLCVKLGFPKDLGIAGSARRLSRFTACNDGRSEPGDGRSASERGGAGRQRRPRRAFLVQGCSSNEPGFPAERSVFPSGRSSPQYSSMGWPVDSIRRFEKTVANAIENEAVTLPQRIVRRRASCGSSGR